MPGTRFDSRHMSVNPLLGNSIRAVNAATPLATVGTLAEKSSSLKELEAGGKVTAPLFETDDLIYVQTAVEMPKAGGNALPRDTGEYSRRDKQVWVISEWEKKGKASKGMLSAKVYDDQNRVRVSVDPKKVSLYSVPTRSGFGFSPASLDPGLYRIDLIWDEKAVWQTFIRITD